MNETVTYVENNYGKALCTLRGGNRYSAIDNTRDTMNEMLWYIGEEGELCYDVAHNEPPDATNRVKGSLWE